MSEIFTLHFILAILQITIIDVLLGVDNAILIALACRNLSPHEQRKGIYYGSVAAILLRFILIFFAIYLLKIPFIKVIGGIILLKIALELITKKDTDSELTVSAEKKLFAAIKTIVIADFIMSLDNVIGIASVAENTATNHSYLLVIFGILISVPIIMSGSVLILKILAKYPQISYLGAVLLGWIAGEILISDKVIEPYFKSLINQLGYSWLTVANGKYFVAAICAILVLVLAKLINWLKHR